MAVALLQSLMFPGIRIDSLKCCPLCSSSLIAVEIGGRQRLACSLCQFVHWDNPKPVTATVVPLDGGLVLVKRKCEPCVGWWCLPGGFMEAGENPEQAARREVFEETGLTVEIDRLLDAQSPGYGLNVVILFYLAKPAAGNLVAGDDAIEVRAFKHDELPDNIAFELHRRMVRDWFDGESSLWQAVRETER